MAVRYGIRNESTRKYYRKGKAVVFFDSKEDAKELRGEMNGKTSTGAEAMSSGWRVAPQEYYNET